MHIVAGSMRIPTLLMPELDANIGFVRGFVSGKPRVTINALFFAMARKCGDTSASRGAILSINASAG